MKITFSAGPAPAVPSDQLVTGLSIELTYTAASESDDGSSATVQRAVRFALDANMRGSIVVEDASDAKLRADVLTLDGARAVSRAITSDAQGNAAWVFDVAEVQAINSVRPKTPSDPVKRTTTRTLRLVPVTDAAVDYRGSTVFTSPVPDREALAAIPVAALQNAGGRIASMELSQGELQSLSSIQWSAAHLAVDGTITATFDRKTGAGWLWWLNGERQLLGFVPDDLATDQKDMAVALPALSAKSGKQTATTSASDCACDKSVSANVTEAELANNPGVYSEDPGSFCEPFSNPERVLSEKSFSLIARITQPEIGAVSSKNVRSVKLLELDGDEPGAGGAASAPRAGGFFTRLFAGAPAEKPAPRATLPLRHILPAAYKAFVAALPSGRTEMNQTRPLQWEDDMAQYQATTVALGHILDFRMRWRSNGYSLGTVAKTLTLAPRQAKRIQKIEWERSERAQRRERTQLNDQENDSTFRERDYQDQVSANLNEWASGSSHSDVEGIAGGIGFFVDGVLGGIGGGAGSSNSTSSQQGGRNTSASEHQRLRDGIRRHGDALRKFESTVVTEVSQEENVTGTTEVVRNLNYAHSLTVIYYQILRHLKVETAFAGARQCLFVPFALRPFDLQRAYRWREAIQASIRSRRFLRALRYLKDVLNNFATSDIPVGTRAQQPLTYLRGSFFIDLAIARPQESTDGTVDPGPWSLLQHLLPDPLGTITSNLQGMASQERDRAFQSRFAPGIAAKWCNRITLNVGPRQLQVDCTLASRYQFNRSVRVDFVVDPSSLAGITRAQLENVTVAPLDPLAPGSVANLRSISFTYSTARFDRTVAGRTGVNDLILQDTGAIDTANVQVPLDTWERVDERLEIRRSVSDLIEHLNEHVEFYHKAIWWRMDRDRLLMMLDGFYVPNTDHVSIASVVDREPLGIIGNCLVYRVGAASFIANGPITDQEKLYGLYAEKEPIVDPLHISLPTDGLYAQTIMDKCLALEEHFGSLDWALNDKDPELGAIDPSLLTSRRADTAATTAPTPFPATIINLQNAPDAPAPSGLQGVLNAVTNPNAFRDMAGLAATQANALAGLQAAAGLATNFGNQAASLELAKMAKAQEATRTADQKLASIKRAEEKGLTTSEEAQRQAKEVLSAMNPDSPKGEAPHTNPAINSAIDAAKAMPGSTVEANTGEGSVKVQMGNFEDALASLGGGNEVILASAGGSKPKEHIILVGGTSNMYNGFGKWGKNAAGEDEFILNPAPANLGEVDAFINAANGSETHDKYWADFLEPVTRLFTNGIAKPKENDIVTILVYYPPYMKRQERDWNSSPWNLQKWANSPWVNGKNPYDPMVRHAEQGAVPVSATPTTPVSSAQSINYAAQAVGEDRIDHEIMMRVTTEAQGAAQVYGKRPHMPNDWMDAIHMLPRRIVFGPQLGGAAQLPNVLVKIILVSDPQQILDYMATGAITARYWKNLLDTVDEQDMGSMEGPSIIDMDDAWYDAAAAPKAGAKRKQAPSAWSAIPAVDRTKVKIVRFDYFGHSNEEQLFLKYAWDNAKGDPTTPHGEVTLSAKDFNDALAGKNAIDPAAEAKLWGCSLGLDFADKFTASFPYVEASEALTSYDNLLSSPAEMPKPVGGATWSSFFAPIKV